MGRFELLVLQKRVSVHSIFTNRLSLKNVLRGTHIAKHLCHAITVDLKPTSIETRFCCYGYPPEDRGFPEPRVCAILSGMHPSSVVAW
jgi:hypothetical protein